MTIPPLDPLDRLLARRAARTASEGPAASEAPASATPDATAAPTDPLARLVARRQARTEMRGASPSAKLAQSMGPPLPGIGGVAAAADALADPPAPLTNPAPVVADRTGVGRPRSTQVTTASQDILKPASGPLPRGTDRINENIPRAPRSPARAVGDVGLAFLEGVQQIPGAAAGAADIVLGGVVGETLEKAGYNPARTTEQLRSLSSPQRQLAQQRFAEAEGVGGKIKAVIDNPLLAVETAASSAPLMAAGATVAGALPAALSAPARAAIGEGLTAAGAQAEDTRQQSPTGRLTAKQRALALGTGVTTGAFGALGGKIAQRFGFADPDLMFAAAQQNPAVAKSVARAIAEGAVAEGLLEEAPQSLFEQWSSNLANNRPINEGVADNVVLGAFAGGLMGGLANVRRPVATPSTSAAPAAAPPSARPPITATARIVSDPAIGPERQLTAGTPAADPVAPTPPPAAPPTASAPQATTPPAEAPVETPAAPPAQNAPARPAAPAPNSAPASVLKALRRRIAGVIDPTILEERDIARRQADTDALTGLANQGAYLRALPAAEADPDVAIIRFDANGFKRVNDELGHAAGDEVLKKMAAAAQRVAGPSARVFRNGGDEFTILAPTERARDIRQAVERAYGSPELAPGVRTSISGGIGQTDAEADREAAKRKAEQKRVQGIPERGAPAAPAPWDVPVAQSTPAATPVAAPPEAEATEEDEYDDDEEATASGRFAAAQRRKRHPRWPLIQAVDDDRLGTLFGMNERRDDLARALNDLPETPEAEGLAKEYARRIAALDQRLETLEASRRPLVTPQSIAADQVATLRTRLENLKHLLEMDAKARKYGDTPVGAVIYNRQFKTDADLRAAQQKAKELDAEIKRLRAAGAAVAAEDEGEEPEDAPEATPEAAPAPKKAKASATLTPSRRPLPTADAAERSRKLAAIPDLWSAPLEQLKDLLPRAVPTGFGKMDDTTLRALAVYRQRMVSQDFEASARLEEIEAIMESASTGRKLGYQGALAMFGTPEEARRWQHMSEEAFGALSDMGITPQAVNDMWKASERAAAGQIALDRLDAEVERRGLDVFEGGSGTVRERVPSFTVRRMQQRADEQGIEVRAAGMEEEPRPLPSDPEVNLALVPDEGLEQMGRVWLRDMLRYMSSTKAEDKAYVRKIEADRGAIDAEFARRRGGVRERARAFGGKEQIIGVAVRHKDTGKVTSREGFDGGHFGLAMDMASEMDLVGQDDGSGVDAEWVEMELEAYYERGFLTDRQEFVSREEALDIARAARQVPTSTSGRYVAGELVSEDMQDAEDMRETAREIGADPDGYYGPDENGDVREQVPAFGDAPTAPAPMWYSALERAVEKMKMPAMPAEDWWAWLTGSTRKTGVKRAELDAVGVEQWLKLRRNPRPGMKGQRVTKEELLTFLRANGVQVQEVMLGAPDPQEVLYTVLDSGDDIGAPIFATHREAEEWIESADEDGVRVPGWHIGVATPRMLETRRAGAPAGWAVAQGNTETRFSQYQEPGGTEYRELSLTLPNFTPGWRAPVAHSFGSAAADMNRIAHVRFNTRTGPNGERVLNLEELQSDRAQEGVRKGFKAALTKEQQENLDRAGAAYNAAQAGAESASRALNVTLVRWNDRAPQVPLDRDLVNAAISAIERNDRLGFGTVDQAIRAIRTHADWAERWDVPDPRDRAAVNEYITVLSERADALDLAEDRRQAVDRIITRGLANNEPVWSPPAFGIPDDVMAAAEALRLARMRQNDLSADLNTLRFAYGQGATAGIEPAPYITDTRAWTALVMKRMIRYAAEHGFDAVSWTPGVLQTKRYARALRSKVDTIGWWKTPQGVHLIGKKNDSVVVDTTEKETALSDAIGKVMADRILKDPAQTGIISGANITIDKTGMAAFYDGIVPSVTKEIVRPLGAEVSRAKLPKAERAPIAVNKKELADLGVRYIDGDLSEQELRDEVGLDLVETDITYLEDNASRDRSDRAQNRMVAQRWAHMMMTQYGGGKSTTVHWFPITPAMRQAALTQGFAIMEPRRGFGDDALSLFTDNTQVDAFGRAPSVADSEVGKRTAGAEASRALVPMPKAMPAPNAEEQAILDAADMEDGDSGEVPDENWTAEDDQRARQRRWDSVAAWVFSKPYAEARDILDGRIASFLESARRIAQNKPRASWRDDLRRKIDDARVSRIMRDELDRANSQKVSTKISADEMTTRRDELGFDARVTPGQDDTAQGDMFGAVREQSLDDANPGRVAERTRRMSRDPQQMGLELPEGMVDSADATLTFGSLKKRQEAVDLTKRLAGGQATVVPAASVPSARARLKVINAYDADLAARIVAQGSAYVEVKGQSVGGLGGKIILPKVHQLLLPFRSPRVEMLGTLFLDDAGEVLGSTLETSGALTGVALGDMPAYMFRMYARARQLGATRVVQWHNHPSGDPTPSMADEAATRELAAYFASRAWDAEQQPGGPPAIRYEGHYVINHETGTFLAMARRKLADGGLSKTPEMVPVRVESPSARTRIDWTDVQSTFRLRGPQDLHPLIRASDPVTSTTVVYMSSQRTVVAMEAYTPEQLATIAQWLPKRVDALAAHSAVIMPPSQGAVEDANLARRLDRTVLPKYVEDIVFVAHSAEGTPRIAGSAASGGLFNSRTYVRHEEPLNIQGDRPARRIFGESVEPYAGQSGDAGLRDVPDADAAAAGGDPVPAERDRGVRPRAAVGRTARVAPARRLPSAITVDGKKRPTANANDQPIHPTLAGVRNFWAWFGDSKAVDDRGRPLVLYHGTVADFPEFSVEGANIESDWGRGVYLTNEPGDVSRNYAGIGPDLENKIERRAEQIEREKLDALDEVSGFDSAEQERVRAEAKAEATAELVQHGGAVLPLYVSLRNPVIVGGDNETVLEYAVDEDGNETGSLVDFVVALRNTAGRFDDGDAESLIDSIMGEAMDGEGISASRIEALARNDEKFGYATDDEGNLAGHEVMRQAFEEAGFDGVIDRQVDVKFGSQRRLGKRMEGMNPDTAHFIAFTAEQVKSATGNDGTFGPTAIITREQAPKFGERATIEVDGVERSTLNADGGLIAPTEEGIRNFWRWASVGFSGAVGVELDAVGRPVVLYHGTPEPGIEVFRRGNKGILGPGIYFTNDRGTARSYSTKRGRGAVVEAYLKMRNPLVVTGGDGYDVLLKAIYGRDSVVRNRERKQGNIAHLVTAADTKKVRDKGHDGIIWRHQGGVHEYVVFESSQIKSATGNAGTFAASPNILREPAAPFGAGGGGGTMPPPPPSAGTPPDPDERRGPDDLDLAASDIDYSGKAQRASKRLRKTPLSTVAQQIADRLSNDLGPIERLGRLADTRPHQNPDDLLVRARSSDETFHRAVHSAVIDPITRQDVGPSFHDLFAPFKGDAAKIKRALTYVYAKRVVFRGIQAVAGNSAKFDRLTNAARIGDRDPALRAFADRWTKHIDAIGNYAVRSGLWTPELWARIKASDIIYVRIKRVLRAVQTEQERHETERAKEAAGGVPPAQSIEIKPGVDRFTGSDMMLENPAIALLEYDRQIIHRSDIYRVVAAVFDAVDALGPKAEGIAQRVAVAPDNVPPEQLDLDGMDEAGVAVADLFDPKVETRLSPQLDPRARVIRRNGVNGQEILQIDTPELWEALVRLTAPTPYETSMLLRATLGSLRAIKRVFTATTTGLAPAFTFAVNPQRDVVTAQTQSQAGMTLGDTARGVRVAAETLWANLADSTLGQLGAPGAHAAKRIAPPSATADEASRAGITGVALVDQDTPAFNAATAAPTHGALKHLNQLRRLLTAPLVALEHVGRASDLFNRVAEYEAAKRKYRAKVTSGQWTEEELRLRAARLGRAITQDFSTQPGDKLLRGAATVTPFLSASLRGPVLKAQAAGRNPKRFGAIYGAMAFAAVAAWVLRHTMLDDDDREEFNDRPATERAGFVYLPVGRADNGQVIFAKVALGQEDGVLFAAITASLNAFYEEDPAAGALLVASLERAMPAGLNELLHATVPLPGIQQIMENRANRKVYGGRPVEPRGMQDDDPKDRRYESTPVTYDLLASAARGLGATEMSPLKAENVTRGVLSKAAPFVTTAVDAVARPLLGREAEPPIDRPLRQSPVNPMSALIAMDPPSRTEAEERFYDLLANVKRLDEQYRKAVEKKDLVLARSLATERSALVPAKFPDLLKNTEGRIKESRAQADAVRRRFQQGRLTEEEARVKLDAIRRETQTMVRRAMQRIETP